MAALIIGGQVGGIPSDDAIERILLRNRASVGAAALATFNMPEHLVELCRSQDDEHVPTGKAWTDLHYVRVVSILNGVRQSACISQAALLLLRSSMGALGLNDEQVLSIAEQLSEHASQVSLLFSTADSAEEVGYLDFVARCLRQP